MKKEKNLNKKWYQKKWVIVIGVILIIGVVGNLLNGDSNPSGNSANPEDNAQAILVKAEEKFNKADYSGMIKLVEQIKKDYPDTEVANDIPSFIERLHNDTITISSVQLVNEYSANEVNADNNYKGKLIIVTGVIDSIDIPFNTPYIRLSDGERYSFYKVDCSLKTPSEVDKSASLQIGQTVSLIGKVKGSTLGSPQLENCFILD